MIVLCGIVKDEITSVTRTLDSFKSVIDKVVLVDTGSTDGTEQAIRDWLMANNVPGLVYSVPWEAYTESVNMPRRADGSHALFDFSEARNLSISLALQHADVERDWLFEVDFCWELRGGVGQLRAGLDSASPTTTAFEVLVTHNGSTVPYLRLRRARECGRSGWRWVSKIHEYLWRQDNAEIGRIEGIWIEHTDTAETAANRQARLLRDLAIFDELIEDYEARNVGARPFTDHERGEYTRAYFFRGQTHENLHEWSPAYEDYKKRAELKGAVFEWSQACYRAGRVAQRMAETEQQNEVLPYWRGKALGWYLESFAVGGRPEGLWEASAIYRASGDTDSSENAAWLAFEAAKGQKPDASSGFSYFEAFALASFGPVRDTAMVSARIRAMGLMGVPFPGKVKG